MSSPKINRSKEEWSCALSPEQYYVLREHGTERAGTSPLNGEKRRGTFACAGCGTSLYRSETKYDSGSGWPSFFAAIEPGLVNEHVDRKFGMVRTEVRCATCDGHLGHVFPDGPPPTGLRYCVNGLALTFTPDEA
jgi:peptide-methionine (R)-S-oxide reductase